jgi:leucyl/phenylalanyl-tRNA--protein transferase
MVPRLGANPASPFPPVETALSEPDGLLAWDGGLEPERLLNAYRSGIFPWYSGDQPILWWSPSRRCVLKPSQVHVSRRLARLIRQRRYRVTVDLAFGQVVAGCALPRPRQDTTWITPEMAAAYQTLHQLGYGHSVEVWSGDEVVGGIYGLSLGQMFFGESMFSLVPDASKLALVALCRGLEEWNFKWLDCQVCNPHLERMGAVEISRARFCHGLRANASEPDRRGNWTLAFPLTPRSERRSK